MIGPAYSIAHKTPSVLLDAARRTTLETDSRLQHPSQEVRDMLIESGMNENAGQTCDKLAELLASQRRGA